MSKRPGAVLIVLGVDPSLNSMGWAVVGQVNGDATRTAYSFGEWKPPAKQEMGQRLKMLYDQLLGLSVSYKPDVLAWERPYVAANVGVTIKLAFVAGIVQLVAAQQQLRTFSYMPTTIKRVVTGSGRSTKEAVAEHVRKQLKLGDELEFSSTDASDACAVALTALRLMRNSKRYS